MAEITFKVVDDGSELTVQTFDDGSTLIDIEVNEQVFTHALTVRDSQFLAAILATNTALTEEEN